MDVILLTRSATFYPIQGGAVAVTRRQDGAEVEDKGHLNDFFVNFVFVRVLCIV
jgi:hypothetical protein